MEYALIFILQFLGIGLHVMQKITQLDLKYPEKSFREIWLLFIQEDVNTIIVSLLVLGLNLVAHYIITTYTNIEAEFQYFHLYNFGAALVLGYAGQRIIYRYLGTAERFLDKKVDNKLQ